MWYFVFAVLLPSLCYLDYLAYRKRLEKELRGQPDYASNEKNYTLLFERLCKKQKSMEFTVGAVLVLLTLVLAGAANGLLG